MTSKIYIIGIEIRENGSRNELEDVFSQLGEWIVIMPNLYALYSSKIDNLEKTRDEICDKINNDLRIYIIEQMSAAWRISKESSDWLKNKIGQHE
ncbi:hypothetical protein [Bacteroides reticulotermitis]|uniref:hypothetical protein n=1 Tax=Bacteroides reticulotermitis TaxID=1133319 RepID=UPI003A8BA6F5